MLKRCWMGIHEHKCLKISGAGGSWLAWADDTALQH